MSAKMSALHSQAVQAGQSEAVTADFVTMTIAGQLFGIPVQQVRDVLGPQRITKVPLAPAEVAGSLNLRGRIVTAIDVRRRLSLPVRTAGMPEMSIVVDHGAELYSLVVDAVREVLSLSSGSFEPNPTTLNQQWGEVASGVYRLDGALLVVLDVSRLLTFPCLEAA